MTPKGTAGGAGAERTIEPSCSELLTLLVVSRGFVPRFVRSEHLLSRPPSLAISLGRVINGASMPEVI